MPAQVYLQWYLALVRTSQHVHSGALPSAVVAKQCSDLVLAKIDCQSVDGTKTIRVDFGQVVDLNARPGVLLIRYTQQEEQRACGQYVQCQP